MALNIVAIAVLGAHLVLVSRLLEDWRAVVYALVFVAVLTASLFWLRSARRYSRFALTIRGAALGYLATLLAHLAVTVSMAGGLQRLENSFGLAVEHPFASLVALPLLLGGWLVGIIAAHAARAQALSGESA